MPRSLNSAFSLIACLLSSLALADEPLKSEKPPVSTETLRSDFSKLMPPFEQTISSPGKFENNGFLVYGARHRELDKHFKPVDKQFDMLQISAPETFKLAFEKGREMSKGGGIGLFHRVSGQPMLTAGDRDGDGHLDVITYTVLDEKDEPLLTVSDFDADGQSDLRVNYKTHIAEVWHKDRWRVVEKRDGVRGVVIDGSFVALIQDGDELRVPAD